MIKQAVDSSRLVTADEKVITDIMQTIFTELAKFDLSLTPPELVQTVHAIIRKHLNNPDPFFNIKKMSTERGLLLAKEAVTAIDKAPNPFAVAVAFAIAGNILDFGMKSVWNEEVIVNSFAKAENQASLFDDQVIGELYREIKSAKTVLVLGDNAGEAVFDRLLIERFPGKAKILYAVKGSPVINDVTKTEAIESGIDKVAEIVSNGVDIPGTVISKCSSEFVELYNSADVIIAKGQGNYETLNEETRKIWFLLQIKCPVIAKHYNYKVGDWLVKCINGSS
ncbi:MAG: DUF89 family protein [Candidatus Delongbacteria bacterium]|nr:DUF89 family protein [Candidatus Delongbacteria bacterium]MCG2761109.1 ARMT1-like domain-containing protein [Candidatus Delongbacteria bacterium]